MYDVRISECMTRLWKCRILKGMKVAIDPSAWSLRLEPRNHDVCVAYASGRYTCGQIAARYNLTRRQVQRIAKQGGVIRTAGESNRLITPLKARHRIRT